MARSARGFDAEHELTGARRKIVPAVPARSFEKRKTGDCWPENG